MMLAQSNFTPPGGIAGWLACLVFILWAIRLGIGLVRDLKDKPHPGEVQRDTAERYVTKPDFLTHAEQNKKDHDNIFSKIGGVERGANSAIESRVEGVRKDLVVVSNQVASLQTETKMQNQQLGRIEKTISEMSERVIATLKNTGAI